jgi:hypothetical protein
VQYLRLITCRLFYNNMSYGLSRLISLIGIAISIYGLHVEHELAFAKAHGLEYHAACDISGFASCSKVFTSSCKFVSRNLHLFMASHLQMPTC